MGRGMVDIVGVLVRSNRLWSDGWPMVGMYHVGIQTMNEECYKGEQLLSEKRHAH